MSHRRIVVPSLSLGSAQAGQSLSLPASFAHYLSRVLRLEAGQKVEICDGKGHQWLALLTSSDALHVELEVPLEATSLPFQLHLVQALAKAERFEWVLQKATELGVTELIPCLTERTIVKLDPKRAQKKMLRWQRVVQEAARQSERATVPSIASPTRLQDITSSLPPGLPWVVCAAREPDRTLRRWIDEHPSITEAACFIGPEGGFSDEELAWLEAQGATCVSLGPLVLRTETAAVTLTSIIQFEYGHLAQAPALSSSE